MRKIIVTEFISLDGVIENPAWTFKYWNDDIASFKGEETSADEPLLLGRVTYEAFAAAWPNRTEDDDPGAVYFNSTRKYVVSTTLETLEWNNSVLISDNIVEEILRLKQEDGPDIVVHGSGNLIQTLMANNLVDRFRLLVYPVVLGKGQRLFTEATTATLELVESRAFGNGVVALIYQPAKAE
ncbi:MAG: dihydrofolate reductase [Anaerolineae bacterium]|nr:dihydrofolate reductase [Anaerolineae bacterium]